MSYSGRYGIKESGICHFSVLPSLFLTHHSVYCRLFYFLVIVLYLVATESKSSSCLPDISFVVKIYAQVVRQERLNLVLGFPRFVFSTKEKQKVVHIAVFFTWLYRVADVEIKGVKVDVRKQLR